MTINAILLSIIYGIISSIIATCLVRIFDKRKNNRHEK